MKLFLFLIIVTTLIYCRPKLEENKVPNSTKSEVDKNENINQNLNRVWILVEFKQFSKEFLINNKALLDVPNNKASMGCNSIGFSYKKKSVSGIEFSNLIRTEMACGDMKLEDDFLEILPKLNSYKIDGHKLTLYNSKNEKMVFVAQDWD